MDPLALSHRILGNRLRTWRNHRGFTQQTVAAALDLHRETISAIEAGDRKLSFVEANLLRRRLDLTFADLTRDHRRPRLTP